MLLEQLLWIPGGGFTLQDNHVALVENVYEAAILQLRLFYKGSRDEIFLDMFEDEYRNEEVREKKGRAQTRVYTRSSQSFSVKKKDCPGWDSNP